MKTGFLLLCAVPIFAQSGVDYVRQVKNKPFYDIRMKNAKCNGDGVDQNTAVQAVLSAGETNILLPAGCTWVAPSGLIPAGLHIVGENIATSIIKSAADPTTATLRVGSGTVLDYLTLNGNTCNIPTNCRITHFENTSDITVNVVSTGWGAYHSVGGRNGIDVTPAFFQVERGLGDGLNASSGSAGQGGGNAARFDCYQSAAGCAFVGRFANIPGLQINDFSDGTNPPPNNSPALSFFTTTMTGGAMVTANQRTSAFAGDVFNFSMADVSGTFTGNYLNFLNGGTQKFAVNSQGVVFFGTTNTPSVRTGVGTPEGVITAPVSSLFLRTDGGATSSVYFKGTGAGNTGWTAVGTGSGAGTVTHTAGALCSTCMISGNGAGDIQAPNSGATLDSSGNVVLPGTVTSGTVGGFAGMIALGAGTDTAVPAGTIGIGAPVSVTIPLRFMLPNAVPATNTVMVIGANSSNESPITYQPFPAPVLTGTTAAIGGGALAAGACTTGTVAVTSSTTAMSVIATPVSDPQVDSTHAVNWMGWVSSAGTVTVRVCAVVATTPASVAYNVRVIQ